MLERIYYLFQKHNEFQIFVKYRNNVCTQNTTLHNLPYFIVVYMFSSLETVDDMVCMYVCIYAIILLYTALCPLCI